MDFLRGLLELYGAGVPIVFAPDSLALILAGVLLGILFGALPGLSSTMALALFTPLTFGLSAEGAIVFLIAIYIASVYAGALAAILVNIPGTPSSIATALDGHPLARKGEAGLAIGTATLASVLGGAFGLVVLMVLSPLLAQAARQFGSWEYAVLAVMGLTLISYVSPGSIVRGLSGGVFGLLVSTIGADVILGYPRFAFGTAELGAGLHVVVLMIGFFGFAEVLDQVESELRTAPPQEVRGIGRALGELRGRAVVILRSSLIGAGIGVLPGAGGSIASITAYGVAKRLSRDAARYGHGSTEGLTAAESSNNASVGGALVPMMTMGIPGDPMTAVLIGALMIHGLTPGPRLYLDSPEFVSSVFLGYLVALVFILVVGLAVARPLARMLAFPRHIVLAVITLLCVLGSFAIQGSLFDVWVALGAGVIGWLLKKVDVHPAPIILGVVLGPLLEHNLRRALLLADGSLLPFVTRPLSLVMLLVVLAVVLSPAIGRLRRR